MGMTIHYRANMDPQRIPELIRDMKSIALIQNWGYTVFLDGEIEDQYKPSCSSAVEALQSDDGSEEEDSEDESAYEIKETIPLTGIIIDPHPESEAVWLLFDTEGDLICLMSYISVREGLYSKENAWASTKTQFAPVEIHILIVELLKHLERKYFRKMEVHDEGQYFETSDIHQLCALRMKTDRALQILADALEAYMPPDNVDPESVDEIADVVEKIVKEFQERLDREERDDG